MRAALADFPSALPNLFLLQGLCAVFRTLFIAVEIERWLETNSCRRPTPCCNPFSPRRTSPAFGLCQQDQRTFEELEFPAPLLPNTGTKKLPRGTKAGSRSLYRCSQKKFNGGTRDPPGMGGSGRAIIQEKAVTVIGASRCNTRQRTDCPGWSRHFTASRGGPTNSGRRGW